MEDRPSPTVALVQLGCEKNTIDGERILGELGAGGYDFVVPSGDGFMSTRGEFRGNVDLMLVNTCAFIGPARDESIDAILEAAAMKKSGTVSRLGVAGCLAKTLHDELTDSLRGSIDFFMGPGDIGRALEIIQGERPFFRPDARSLDAGPRVLSRGNRVAYIKIAEGCDKACSFCTIPSFKGSFVSKPSDAILNEMRALSEIGVREFVLVSQDTVSWGREFGEDLLTLIERIDRFAASHSELFRESIVRIHYLYPSQVTSALVEAMIASPVIANYFDIPIQHSSPKVLKAMNRPPDSEKIRKLVASIRERAEESAIRTTVMTGHPGESKGDFEDLMNFISEIQFDRLGVFAYSNESGTPSSTIRGRRPSSEEARARAEEVISVQEGISRSRLKLRIGRCYRVLMDSDDRGRSEFEAPDVDGSILIEGNTGEFVDAIIVGADTHDLAACRVRRAGGDDGVRKVNQEARA